MSKRTFFTLFISIFSFFSLEVDLNFIYSLGHTVDIRDVLTSVSIATKVVGIYFTMDFLLYGLSK